METSDHVSKNQLPYVIAIVVVAGALSFYGGMRYAKGSKPLPSAEPSFAAQGRFPGGGRAGSGNGGNGRVGSGFSAGEVVSRDASSLTLHLNDGGSRVVFFASTTIVGKMATGTLEDLQPGSLVTVTGSTGKDGSISASMIQLRPQAASGTRPAPFMPSR